MATTDYSTGLNPIIPFDDELLNINPIHEEGIKSLGDLMLNRYRPLVLGDHHAAWLLKAISLIDLTTLAGDDTRANVTRLCHKAVCPLRNDIVEKLGISMPLKCAAICVYPDRVLDARTTLSHSEEKVPIASVATGFPAGQTFEDVKILEIKETVAAGAKEIDIVISRKHVIAQDWKSLYNEVVAMKKACGDAHMKTILAVGEIPTFTDVYKASMVAMMAGSEFIKTSTGKEATNATIPVGIVMARAIKDFERAKGIRVGLKAAGGIRTCSDAIDWLILVKEQLGHEWLNPTFFRIGASGLLSNIEKELYKYAFGFDPAPNSLPVA